MPNVKLLTNTLLRTIKFVHSSGVIPLFIFTWLIESSQGGTLENWGNMNLESNRQSLTDRIFLGKIVQFAASLAAAVALTVGGGNPATADEKPVAPKTPTFVGNVDATVPHISSEDLGQARDLGPCSYLLAGIAPLGLGWSTEFRWIACSFWGANAAATKNYQWYVSPGSSSMACAQGYGFRPDHSPFWAYLSCGDSGATQVPWGSVAAYPKMKFKSLSGLVVPLYWY